MACRTESLAACASVTPVTVDPVSGAEMAPDTPGLVSGESGAVNLSEKK